MKILITGSAGFLGTHLTRELLKLGHQVTGVDDFTTGSMNNLIEFKSNPNYEFFSHDIRNPLNMAVDVIFNLACPASPIHYQADPVKTIETNFLGMFNVLQLANKQGARVIQASTSEVYGDPKVSPQTESYWGNVNPIGPRSCYDEGKRAAETLCFDYKRQFGTDVRVVRIFNTYGPSMAVNDGRVVSNFIIQALTSKPLTIFGEGKQTRSFCYVTDLIRGLIGIAFLPKTIDTPVNIGNPNEFTMIELAEQVLRLTKSSSPLLFKELPKDDPLQRKPDISRIQDLISWEPTIDITQGIELTIDYFRGLKLS
jgi:UDP-glucuronate decarboxylase